MMGRTFANTLAAENSKVVRVGNQETTHDGEMVRAAQNVIRSCPYNGALRMISCSAYEGVLVLHGRVNTFFHKQQAQEAVRRVPGIREIINAVEVI